MVKIFDAVGGAVQIALHVVLGPFLHRWRTQWGATAEEIWQKLPGDELVRAPGWSFTRAITIAATRSDVWPWLVQIGQGRGGFYSYEGLENLVGCDIHNVLEIRPELQRLRVGDTIRMLATGFGPRVMMLDPERALVLGGQPHHDGSQAMWAFYLFDRPDGTTRLIERGRHVAGAGLLGQVGWGPYLVDPIGFVMSRKMLRTIKRLAEGRSQTQSLRAIAAS
jgi:hypothetical protein